MLSHCLFIPQIRFLHAFLRKYAHKFYHEAWLDTLRMLKLLTQKVNIIYIWSHTKEKPTNVNIEVVIKEKR